MPIETVLRHMEICVDGGKPEKKKLNCDQVARLNILLGQLQTRYTSAKMEYGARLITLLEIMELLGYEFEDKAAADNAICHFPELSILHG